jgi:transposase
LLKIPRNILYLIANAVRRLTEKFHETGSVLDAERSGRPSKLNDKQLMDISDSMLRNASESLCKLAQDKDTGLTTVHKAVREKQPLPIQSKRGARIQLNLFRPV